MMPARFDEPALPVRWWHVPVVWALVAVILLSLPLLALAAWVGGVVARLRGWENAEHDC